jgi:hypothetical protein
MCVDVSFIASPPAASAAGFSALVTPVGHSSSAPAAVAAAAVEVEVATKEAVPLSSGEQIEVFLKDLLSCVSLFKSYCDPSPTQPFSRAAEAHVPEQPSSSSGAGKHSKKQSADPAQARVKLLEGLLFPSDFSGTKPAELCNADLLTCMMQDAFR